MDQTARGEEQDVIAILEAEHRSVELLFDRFHAGTGGEREKAALTLAEELTLHTAVEEQVLYPEVRRALEDPEPLVEQGMEEHQEMKRLTRQLREMDPSDPALEGLVVELKNIVGEHLREEEEIVFPMLRDALDGKRRATLADEVRRAREHARA